MVETATEIMFSYLIFIGFITVFISLTGQNFFGATFPANPFSTIVFSPVTCLTGDLVCEAAYWINTVLKLFAVPFQIMTYLWAIFVFFMASPALWWVGIILFVPAGVILLMLFLPIIIALIHAIAEIIPF